MPEPEQEKAWLLAARNGSKEAYGKLVYLHQKRLLRLVFMMLGRRDAVEDIIQEAFIKGYQALADFDLDKPFYPWISTIARNLALNYIKRDLRQESLEELEKTAVSFAETGESPLDDLIVKENEKRFARAVLALPEAYRTVFVLRMMENLSYEEIAGQLKISVGTVDSRLYRAREKLVEMLKDLL